MNNSNSLSLEQEFNLKKVATQVQALSHQQAQELVVELQRQIMIKDNLYKKIIKQEWNI
ncbi:MAG: NblA/ycf18 family protein [Cyanobacteria bacterium J06607_15]